MCRTRAFFLVCAGLVLLALGALSIGCSKDQAHPTQPIVLPANVVLVGTMEFFNGGSCATQWQLKNTGRRTAYRVWVEATTGAYATTDLGPGEADTVSTPLGQMFAGCPELVAIHWSHFREP